MISFREIIEQDASMLLAWRRKPRIASQMLTEVDNDLQKQIMWILNSRNKNNSYHWIVKYRDKDIGYVKISDYNFNMRTTDCGFYIGEDEFTYLAIPILHIVYSYIYEYLNIDSINIFVVKGNPIEILHKFSGYEQDKNISSKILGNGKILIPYILHKNIFKQKHTMINVKPFPLELWAGRFVAD